MGSLEMSYVMRRETEVGVKDQDVISIDEINDREQFRALEKEWSALLQDCSGDSFFMTWEWMYTWWENASHGYDLVLLLVRCNGVLSGLLPLCRRPAAWHRLVPFRAVQFIGTGNAGPDYLDVLIRTGYQKQVTPVLQEWLLQQGMTAEFYALSDKNTSVETLFQPMREAGWVEIVCAKDVCPFMTISGLKWDDYLATLGSSHRANVRRRLRALDRDFDMRFEQADTPESCTAMMQELLDLHLLRWRERGGSTALEDSDLVRFHFAFSQLALQRGWLRLQALKLDGRTVAVVYTFNYKGRLLYYQAGFDTAYSTYSVGLACIALSIQSAMLEGANEYDFLHGDEQYKFLWAQERRYVVRVDLMPPGRKGMFQRRFMWLRSQLKRLKSTKR